MPTIYKVLGQVATTANTTANLYTVPASANTVISTLSICNTTTSNVTANVMVRPNSGSISTNSYIVSGVTINNNDTLLLTLGLSLGSNDLISVSSNVANVSFNLFGSEVTA